MSFQEFEKKNLVAEKGFSWEIEQDSMNWEHTIESIRYLEDKIKKIQEISE